MPSIAKCPSAPVGEATAIGARVPDPDPDPDPDPTGAAEPAKALSGAPFSSSAVTSAPATGSPAPSTTKPVSFVPPASAAGTCGPSGARTAAPPACFTTGAVPPAP